MMAGKRSSQKSGRKRKSGSALQAAAGVTKVIPTDAAGTHEAHPETHSEMPAPLCKKSVAKLLGKEHHGFTQEIFFWFKGRELQIIKAFLVVYVENLS